MTEPPTIRSPEFKPVLTALRSLVPLVYVRTAKPEIVPSILASVGTNRKVSISWSIFTSTDPNLPLVRSSGGNTPGEVITSVLAGDLRQHYEQGLGVIQFDYAHTISNLASQILAFHKRQTEDPGWCMLLYFTSTLPATKAVPKALWDIFYPIDLIDGCKTEGEDTRVREGLPNIEEVRKTFADWASYLGYEVSEKSVAQEAFAGMTTSEIHEAMKMSLINQRLSHPEADRKNPDVQFVHPPTVDAYRNRWARVANSWHGTCPFLLERGDLGA